MKSLREYTINLGDHSPTQPLTWGHNFPTPIRGMVNGVAVVAVCPANLPGASPTFLCNDVDKTTGAWALVKITDFIGTLDPTLLEGTTRQSTLAGSTR